MAGGPASVNEIAADLISFDTTSRESNLKLIEFIERFLRSHDVESVRVLSEDGRKANLFATIGPPHAGGIVLSGHTDVVPVDGQDWSTDPFQLVEKNGAFYGRGTADMKSFIACALAAVPVFVSRNLATPIHLAFSYDEEVGCVGVHHLVRHIAENFPRPQIVIVGEPTEMKVVNAHKGIRAFVTTVTGLEAHSSNTHKGVNAIEYAAEMIGFLGRLAEEMRERGDSSGRFDPPYTTLHVGKIEGGTAGNIVPRRCRFWWEFRALPDQSEPEIIERVDEYVRKTLIPRMRAVSPDTGITTHDIAHVPSLRPLDGSPAESLALSLSGGNEVHAVSYGTEGGIFQDAGIPTVICGPGSIAQAHIPNEFVRVDQIDACMRFMGRLAEAVTRN